MKQKRQLEEYYLRKRELIEISSMAGFTEININDASDSYLASARKLRLVSGSVAQAQG